jgi:predicted dehydrogenase
MKRRRLKTAVIGLGAAGRFHCETIAASVPEMELVAVVESVPEVAARTAAAYGVPAFATCAELIRARVCEAVTIATPHTSHADVAVQCLQAGLHVITEKPMSESVAGADRMLRAARARRLALACVFQKRFDPFVAKALALVRSGRLGRLCRATMVFCDFRTQSYYDSNVWRATWKGEGGGVLLNQAPHNLDVFTQLAGLPETVLGRVSTRCHRIEVEDHAEALLGYRGGATGYVLCSTNEPAHGNFIEIAGDQGRLVLREGALEVFTYRRALRDMAQRSPDMWGRPEVKPQPVTVKPLKAGHAHVLRDFAKHVLHGRELRCDAASALLSLDLANAITLSSYTGEEVRLPVARQAYATLLRHLQKTSIGKKKRVRVQRTTDPRMR